MKTKYKILIASVLVLSLLTAFAVTSFAYTSTDITYDDNTYTYAGTISNTSNYFEVLNLTKFEVVVDGVSTIYTNSSNSDIVILLDNYRTSSSGSIVVTGIDLYIYEGNRSDYMGLSPRAFYRTYLNYTDGSYINIILYGDYTFSQFDLSPDLDDIDIPNIANGCQYNVFVTSNDATAQFNILNANQPNPLEKVNDFLGYLSTSLNKLTTMIITNQILILFIVAVPVVSFVIGSFKRIKDAGRA